jgi:hypothetical protein
VAKILLRRHEVEERALPYVCLRCGRPANLWKTKNFILAAPYGAAAVGKLSRIEVPLCSRHRRHWLWRALFGVLGGLVVASFLIGLAGVAEPQSVSPAWRDALIPFFGVGCVGLPLWLPVMLILHFTSVRPTKVTEDDITLAGVSRDFVEKLKEFRRQSLEERKAARRAGRKRKRDAEE